MAEVRSEAQRTRFCTRCPLVPEDRNIVGRYCSNPPYIPISPTLHITLLEGSLHYKTNKKKKKMCE